MCVILRSCLCLIHRPSSQMQQDRLGLPPTDDGDSYGVQPPPSFNMDHSSNTKEPGLVKRLLFWSI